MSFLQGKKPPKAPKGAKKKSPQQAARAGRVIVVGAGPAGLAAALHLQVRSTPSCPVSETCEQVSMPSMGLHAG